MEPDAHVGSGCTQAAVRQLKRWTPVIIKWNDAHGGGDTWGTLPKAVHRPEPVTTVGMLYKANKHGVTVVLSRTSRHVDCYIFIPRSGIESIEELT